MNLLNVSGSPHVYTDNSVKKIMYGVVYAMMPALLVSIYFFGLDAVRVTLMSVVMCLLVEYVIQKYVLKTEVTITDGSALITGILLAFNVPANLPWWIILIGAIVSIGVGKMSFGGLGKNIFNPALVGRVFLLISFPVQMTSWPVPKPLGGTALTDAITGPTPLGIMKDYPYEVSRCPVEKGQILVIGTDGIWEAFDPEGNLLGKERFKEIIRSSAHLPAAAITETVIDAVRRFSRPLQNEDDITLVVVKFED